MLLRVVLRPPNDATCPSLGYGIRGRAAREHGDDGRHGRHQRAQLRLEERHRDAMKEARADDIREWDRYARLRYRRTLVDSDSDSDSESMPVSARSPPRTADADADAD